MALHPLSFTTILLLFYAPLRIDSRTFTEFVYPNFTASNFQFIDSAGAFLSSINGTFQASISNPVPAQNNFYLSIVHPPSNTVIWSANRRTPISNSGTMTLTPAGISISDEKNTLIWSTPPLKSQVTALRLLETGNLVLEGRSNITLWQSFDHPTDTILIGQKFYTTTTPLQNSASRTDLSPGDYQFSVTRGDAILQWKRQQYWTLSRDLKAIKNSNFAVSYAEINRSGLFLFSDNGSAVVWQVNLQNSDFRIAVLDPRGKFRIRSFSSNGWTDELAAPEDDCRLPLLCGRLGLCSSGSNSDCSCSPQFHAAQDFPRGGCVPSSGVLPTPTNCSSNSATSYIRLRNGAEYFVNDFVRPAIPGSRFSECQDQCSKNCSCLGFFYTNSSSSCYLIKDQLGSILLGTAGQDSFGYIKTYVESSTSDSESNNGSGRGLPIIALVLLPCAGVLLMIIIVLVGILWWRRWKLSKTQVVKLGRRNSSFSGDELDHISIPGLPVRFMYEELEEATDGFKTQIGVGGFGVVYKGTLPDKTLVAVKKINSVSMQGKKDFLTEIAIIGSVRHINLVRLRGFCAQGTRRLLVYEYMNRSSLDRSLFGLGSPVLEWQERVEIAVGTARGLAYLHAGCEHKIIHCDIKPENILLHDNWQPKISDFGLSKLLSPEQSNFFTTMRGTRGYLAPEWLTNAAISDKTDVYSYGMVLLEIVHGRKNSSMSVDGTSDDRSSSSSSSSRSSAYFPLLALEMHEQGRYVELADPRLKGRVTGEEVEKLVRVALCCVHEDPMLRPSMANVVAMLEGGIALGEPRIESLNFLRFYGRRFTEPSMVGDNAAIYQLTTSSSSSHSSVSYLSSQQVSGPR